MWMDICPFQIVLKSNDLRPYVEDWRQRMEEVDKFVDVSKNMPETASSSSSSSLSNEESDDDESADKDKSKALQCEICEPPGKIG